MNRKKAKQGFLALLLISGGIMVASWWVIQKVNGRTVDRRFDGWPMIEGSGIN